MNLSAPRRKAETVLEYSLFAAILVMTISGVFLHQAIVRDPLLAGFTNYLIVVYLVFLALAFGQLNGLHRKRAHSTPLNAQAALIERPLRTSGQIRSSRYLRGIALDPHRPGKCRLV